MYLTGPLTQQCFNNNNNNNNNNNEIKFKSYMYMVKFRKFCNNNDDNLNKKRGNTVLCTLHLMSDAFGTYEIF